RVRVRRGHADPVVADGPDRARYVRPVPVVVHRVAVVVDEVIPVHVVNKTVPFVVDAVAGDLARVGPDVRGQVRVVVIDPGVDDRDHHVPAAGADVPGLGGVDVGVRRTAALAGVVETVQGAEGGVVRDDVRVDDEVRLGERDPALGPEVPEGPGDGDARLQVDAVQTAAHGLGPAGERGAQGRGGVEFHQDVAGGVVGRVDLERPVGRGHFAGFERLGGQKGRATLTDASHSGGRRRKSRWRARLV